MTDVVTRELEYWTNLTDAEYDDEVARSDISSYEEAKSKNHVRTKKFYFNSCHFKDRQPRLVECADAYQEQNMGKDGDELETLILTLRDVTTGEQSSFFLKTEVTVDHECNHLIFSEDVIDEEEFAENPNQLTLPL